MIGSVLTWRDCCAKRVPGARRDVARRLLKRSLPLGLAALAALAMAAASIYRHNRFGSSAFDLGIFDQAVWQYSRLEAGPNTVKGIGNILGDHFHPVVAAAAPLYWIWPDARALLVLQALLVAASTLPLYLWSRDQLGTRSALQLQAAYLLSWPVIAAVLFDFHELAFAPLFVSAALWALHVRNRPVYWASIVLLLLVKEDMALVAAGIGLVAIALDNRRRGFATIGLAAVWVIAAVEVVIPGIAGRPYAYSGALGSNGTSPIERVWSLVADPLETASRFGEPEKLMLALALMGVFAGVSLFSPIAIAALPAIAARFLSANPAHWDVGLHYSLPLVPILAFAAADALRRLRSRPRSTLFRLVLPAMIVSTVVLTLTRPIVSDLRSLADEKTTGMVRQCLGFIPPEATVVATQALVPHLSERAEIYTFYSVRLARMQPEFAAIEIALAPKSPPQWRVHNLLQGLRARQYAIECRTERVVVLRRNGTHVR